MDFNQNEIVNLLLNFASNIFHLKKMIENKILRVDFK